MCREHKYEGQKLQHHIPQLKFWLFDSYVCWEQTVMKQHASCMETSLLSAYAHAVHVPIEL